MTDSPGVYDGNSWVYLALRNTSNTQVTSAIQWSRSNETHYWGNLPAGSYAMNARGQKGFYLENHWAGDLYL